MALSKRAREGYLLVDNSQGCGVPASVIAAAGKDPRAVPGAGRPAKLESATVTCAHCNVIVVLNPGRTRERGYCARCDAYVCDVCTGAMAVAGCVPFKKILDDAEAAARKVAANQVSTFSLRKELSHG